MKTVFKNNRNPLPICESIKKIGGILNEYRYYNFNFYRRRYCPVY